jgi:hypothetical protein
MVLAAFCRRTCGLEISEEDISTLEVRTQQVVPGGRPDLSIKGPRHFLLVEAKVEAWLHTDQAVPYAHAIREWLSTTPDGVGRLITLTPAMNCQRIRDEAERQLLAQSLAIAVIAVPWEQVASLCLELAPQAADPRLAIYLKDFHHLVSWRLGTQPRAFTQGEVEALADAQVGGLMINLRRVLHLTRDILQRWLSVSSGTAKSGEYFGFNILSNTEPGVGLAWFGVWFDAWAALGESPMFLQLTAADAVRVDDVPRALGVARRIRIQNVDQILVALPLAASVDPVVVAEGVANQILAWLRALGKVA